MYVNVNESKIPPPICDFKLNLIKYIRLWSDITLYVTEYGYFCAVKRVTNSDWKISYKILSCVILVLGMSGNVAMARMPDDTLGVKVYYPCGSGDVSRIPANAPCLERFIHDLDSLCRLPFFKPFALTVTSSASPEGSIGRNRALSHARAMSALDFLNGRSEAFRHISSSLDCSIDEQTTNDMAGQVKVSHYPKMRFSEVMLCYSQGEDSLQAVSPPVVDEVSRQGQAEAPADSVRTGGLPAEEAGDVPTQSPPRQGEGVAAERRPVLFVKTNLPYDLLTFVNVAVEVPLGRRFSVEAQYVNPWWNSVRKHRTIELRYVSLAPRYYFGRDGRRYSSLFAGLSAGWGKYDMQLTRHGVQGELWHVSPVLGYSHYIGRHWKMEYSVSAGYLHTDYHKYTQKSGTPYGDIKVHDYPWVSHTFRSVLPTSLGVSLVYVFHGNKAKTHK